ncbi:MAG: hypothetical protein PHR69_05110 [Sphaerochaeta sp.]|nr:hypothetical protein [Sphaerochaeta sp.]
MNTYNNKDMKEKGEELSSFPLWFLSMTESKPLCIVFAITVLLCAPLLMLFGALYPLIKH